MAQTHCPDCGRFLDRYAACVHSCGYGWLPTLGPMLIHPADTVGVHRGVSRDGTEYQWVDAYRVPSTHGVIDL